MRDALRVALALAPAPNGFTVAEFTAKVYALAGHDRTGHSIRQTAYDPRKLRGKPLVDKPGRSPQLPRLAASGTHDRRRLALRDQGIAPILAGVRTPMGRQRTHWTRVDRDYERIRIDMQTLFTDLAIEIPLAA
ncbi:hypothetical protein [Mycobacterium avium]|nr:hypothetical protein [Mycobacterium avium]QXD08170.1 hypothetical protein BB735_011865 [Mycobacterium avium subsp. hominissuis]